MQNIFRIFLALLLLKSNPSFADVESAWLTIKPAEFNSKFNSDFLGYYQLEIPTLGTIPSFDRKPGSNEFQEVGKLSCTSYLPIYRSGYFYSEDQICNTYRGNQGTVLVLDREGEFLKILFNTQSGETKWIRREKGTKEKTPADIVSENKTKDPMSCVAFLWPLEGGKLTIYKKASESKISSKIDISPGDATDFLPVEIKNGFVRLERYFNQIQGPPPKSFNKKVGWVKLKDPLGRTQIIPFSCSSGGC